MSPKISIITVNYNKGKYIEDTILSVLSQNYENKEYILIDGASTDNSLDIIDKYKHKIDYFISEPDNGMTEALIKGFTHATGDILCWLNSDDIFTDNALKEVAKIFSKNDVDILFGNGYFVNSNNDIIKPFRISKLTNEALASGATSFMQPSTFWSSDIFKKVGGIDKSFNIVMDLDLFTRILYTPGVNVSFSSFYFSRFRIHPEQSSSWATKESYVYEIQRIRERYKVNKLRKVYLKICCKIFKM